MRNRPQNLFVHVWTYTVLLWYSENTTSYTQYRKNDINIVEKNNYSKQISKNGTSHFCLPMYSTWNYCFHFCLCGVWYISLYLCTNIYINLRSGRYVFPPK